MQICSVRANRLSASVNKTILSTLIFQSDGKMELQSEPFQYNNTHFLLLFFLLLLLLLLFPPPSTPQPLPTDPKATLIEFICGASPNFPFLLPSQASSGAPTVSAIYERDGKPKLESVGKPQRSLEHAIHNRQLRLQPESIKLAQTLSKSKKSKKINQT